MDAYCCQASDACPTNETTFTVKKTKDVLFQKLFGFMKGKEISSSLFQSMVWTVSDKHSVAPIPDNTPVDKALRKFLCELTNQKETWYSSSQTSRLNDRGYIVMETTEVGGNLKFNSPKNTLIHQEVHKNGGGVMMRSEKRRTLWDGEVSTTFHIRVKGWQKGKYTLKIMTDKADTLATYEFEV